MRLIYNKLGQKLALSPAGAWMREDFGPQSQLQTGRVQVSLWSLYRGVVRRLADDSET